MTRLTAALVAIFSAAVLSAQVPATPQAPADPNLAEGRRLFETLDYENAVKALDLAIATHQAAAATFPESRQLLLSAYELRARSKFGLGDADAAQADFVSLLRLNPTHTLTGDVSPRVVALFDATVQANVIMLNVSAVPPTAKLMLDGAPISAGMLRVAVGDHELSAEQPGYRRLLQPFRAETGAPADVVLTLERSSAVLNILTAPPGVDVTLDGKSIGRTATGPPTGEYAQALAQAKVAAGNVSSVLTIVDVMAGAHVLEFARECHVRVRRNLTIETLADYTVGPVTLEPATAILTVSANVPEARVVIDGKPRGNAPVTVFDLCEGEHSVDILSSVGRFSRRIDARAGDKIPIDGVMTPAFVLLPSGVGADLVTMAARALEPLESIDFVVPPAAQATTVLESLKAPADWLVRDAGGAAGGAAGPARLMRTELSARIAAAFETQGVAVLASLPDNRSALLLLAAGNADPDVLEMRLGSPESVKEIVSALGPTPPLFRTTLGLTAIDVADVPGALVIGVDPENKEVRAGDVIVAIDGQAVANATALDVAVASRKAGDSVPLDVTAADGTKRRVNAAVLSTPRLISQFDPAVLANRVLLDLRARLTSSRDETERSVIRLNIAVALARAGRWSDAQVELKQVRLPDGPRVSSGTVQYLLGLAAHNLGDRAGAEAALKQAESSGALLTEEGPPVRDLARLILDEIQPPTR